MDPKVDDDDTIEFSATGESTEVDKVDETTGVDVITEAIDAVDAVTVAKTLEATVAVSELVTELLKVGTGIGGFPEGKYFVHQKAIRTLRSTSRSLRMKRVTRKKNPRPKKMLSRSNQSAFCSAVMSCFEVSIALVSLSCVDEASRMVLVDAPEERETQYPIKWH